MPFRYWYNKYDAMYQISQDLSYDPLTWYKAESLAYHMKCFKLLCCAVSSHYIFEPREHGLQNTAAKKYRLFQKLKQNTLIISAVKAVLRQNLKYYIWRPIAQKRVCKCTWRCQTDGCTPWQWISFSDEKPIWWKTVQFIHESCDELIPCSE
jgi:hypothetical protein